MATKKDAPAKESKKMTKIKKTAPKHIGLVANDGYLAPYEDAINGRHEHAVWKLNMLTNNGKRSLESFSRRCIQQI